MQNTTKENNAKKDDSKFITPENEPFFFYLKKNYLKLSISDRLICYLLIIEFKNIQIADYFNSSIRSSIEGRRYRIAKKMGIDKSKHLKEKLLKINNKLKLSQNL